VLPEIQRVDVKNCFAIAHDDGFVNAIVQDFMCRFEQYPDSLLEPEFVDEDVKVHHEDEQ
jgi:hypothetical protein